MAAEKILIVQDDSVLAGALKSLIDDAGYQVVGVARDTAGAERLAAQHRPVLVIVDMMLEVDVDGIATATALKQNYDLLIIITTGFPDSVMRQEGVEDLACAVVRKPYMDEDILHALARCLHGSAHAQP